MDNIIDIVAMTTFTAYGVHSQCMLGNLAQHCKLRSLPWVTVSQSDWHKVGSVDGQSTNHVTGDQKCMEKRNIVDR